MKFSANDTELSSPEASDSLTEEEARQIIEEVEAQAAQVRVGGKLYLAGEYAILTAGQSAIINYIPIYQTAEIAPADAYEIASDLFDYSVGLEPDSNYSLIQETIAFYNRYLEEEGVSTQPFSLAIRSNMQIKGIKIGLGSSGAVVLLVLKAMSALYQRPLDPISLFKLGSLVLLARGDNGSMGDLAAISFESLVTYKSFDRAQVLEWMKSQSVKQVLDQEWGFEIRPLEPGISMDFLVGWTQSPAISKWMVGVVNKHIDAAFLSASDAHTLALEEALLAGDADAIRREVASLSQLLDGLSPQIYTEKLRALKIAAQGLDAVAKSSGAGGGDCGVALSFDEEASRRLVQRWEAKDIVALYQGKLGPHEAE